MPEPDIAVQLESALPGALTDAIPTAIFCLGSASIDGAPAAGLALLVDGVPQSLGAQSMPRFDLSPRRSGFWAVIDVTPRAPELTLALALSDAAGRVVERELARIPVAALEPGLPASQPAARETPIVVCMATHNPPPELFAAQLRSLRAQVGVDWTCVISDDASEPDSYAALLAAVGDDPRFRVSHSPERLGFYRNFERALGLIPPDAALVALADQDDVWHPDKLATLAAAIGDCTVAYSDMRLVDTHGTVLADTLWRGRANNPDNLASLLIAPSITGAAMLLRRDVVAASLPFPDSPGIEFHDHWLSLVALACGDIAYVPRPLYDYVQHAGAVVGQHSGTRLASAWREGLRIRHWRAAYFLGYVPGQVRARTLLARCGDHLSPAKARALRRYLACESSLPALAWLLLRPLRALSGANETLGSEWELARGLLWRWAAGWVAARRGWPERLLLDCRFPDPPLWRQRRLQRWRARLTPPVAERS